MLDISQAYCLRESVVAQIRPSSFDEIEHNESMLRPDSLCSAQLPRLSADGVKLYQGAFFEVTAQFLK